MSRDPAFLWYDGDAARDVSHMNRLERGAYFDIVQAQRKFRGITVEQARKILGSDFESVWPSIEMILEHDETGKYIIPWVQESIDKRNKFNELQKNKIQNYWDNKHKKKPIPRNYPGNTVEIPLEDEKEIEIEIEDVKETEKKIVTEFRECSELLKKRILERRQQKITDKTLFEWDTDVRLMVERDSRKLPDIKQLITECHDMEPGPSGFTWRNNILSMKKLREKWNDGKIFIGMNKPKERLPISRPFEGYGNAVAPRIPEYKPDRTPKEDLASPEDVKKIFASINRKIKRVPDDTI